MKGSKLIVLLESIQKDEMRWLAKWIRSPYYNSNELVIKLFEYLRKYSPVFSSKKIEKQKIFDHLFPGKVYDDQRLRVLSFRLTNLIEKFLIAERLKKDSFQKQRLLYAELGERDLYNLFDKKKHELIDQLDKEPFRDEYYYLGQWRLQHDHFFHPQTYRYRDSSMHLKEMMQNLDAFFMLAKMRYSTELRNRQNIFSEEHEIVMLDEAKILIHEHPVFKEDTVFQVYRDVLGLMEEPENETIFLRLEKNVTHHLDLFRPSDQASMIRYLINTTIQLYNKGKKEYLEKQFRLYQLGLQNDLFIVDGKLPDGTFLNIIVTATILSEIDWGEDFMVKYSPKIIEDKRIDAVNLGTAYCCFAKGEFKFSLTSMREVERNDLHSLLRIKSLSLRSYFELFLNDDTYFELVDHESKAFEKFLRRHELLSESRVRSYLTFISYLRKLASLKTTFQLSDKKLEILQKKLELESTVIAKQWLIEKIENLC